LVNNFYNIIFYFFFLLIINFIYYIVNITQPNAPPLTVASSKIYLLDIKNYAWVGTFEKTVETTQSSPPTSDKLTTMKIVVAAISGIVGTAILIGIGVLLYKLHKKRKERETLRISGNFES